MANKIKKDIRIINHRVFLLALDWDKLRQVQVSSGKGFIVSEQGMTDAKETPGLYSIHSPLFGSSWEDDRAFMDRYSCKCKQLIGKIYDGVFCPNCGSKVEFIDIDMEKTGWICFDNYQIIQSEFYKKIAWFIGKKNFASIVKFIEFDDREPLPTNPFQGYGIIEFKENFDEIMKFFLDKNKRYDTYVYIMANKQKVFTSSIPVYSSHLRLFLMQGDSIRYSDEDKIYNRLFSNSELLNSPYKLEQKIKRKKTKDDVFRLRKENILYSMQHDLNTLWDKVFDTIDKKTGHINEQLLGGRLNYTARNVIIPDVDLRADQVKLGYITFLELYKLEIIAILQEMYSITPPEAWDMWEKASIHFSDKIYRVMNHMITRKPIYVLVNRSTTRCYMKSIA